MKGERSIFPFTLFKIQFESWFSRLYLDILGNGERDLIISAHRHVTWVCTF